MRRRDFLKLGAAAWLAGCASPGGVKPKARVLVIGAGFGGATAAKYVAMWEPGVQVVLVDRGREFISCPISNLVLGGNRSMRDITHSYDGLRKYGIDVLNGEAVAIDSAKKLVTFGRGSQLVYDRLVLSPGVDFLFSEVEGYEAAADRVLHAWKAGPQTVELRRQLEAMPDGGVYLLSVPVAPYRCPPGPYERACQVAHYFKQTKPRSKVLLLDANPDVTSKGPLFKRAWDDLYKGIIEYRPNAKVLAVDGRAMTVRTEFDTVKGDVLNVVPPQRAADIAVKAALTGHQVLSTLHTNDAAGAITRLDDMGIEPFLIASSVLMTCAQRLVRRVCMNCREEFLPDAEMFEKLGLEPKKDAVFYRGSGCDRCKGRGYLGRTAIIEALPVSEPIRRLIIKRASAAVIKNQAVTEGMKTLRMAGVDKAIEGVTTLEEVWRVTAEDR